MTHASNTPRPKGSRKPRRGFWRGLGGFLLYFVKPNDWRSLTVGVFLTLVGLGGVLNSGGRSFWELLGLVAIGLFGLVYTAACVVTLFKQMNERPTR